MSEPYDFAAAARRRAGEYAELDVPEVRQPLEQTVIDTFVIPFYMTSLSYKFEKFLDSYRRVSSLIDDPLISDLLAQYNWRPRITGAYFAAIQIRPEFSSQIGRLLLRSDLCYAGRGYALALARFNTGDSIHYLKKYLDHYLNRPDLDFDQAHVMGALVYTDRLNDTELHKSYLKTWERFVADKPNQSLESSLKGFDVDIAAISKIAEEVAK